MLKILALVVAVLISGLVAYGLWNYFTGEARTRSRLMATMAPIPEVLRDGGAPDAQLLDRYAARRDTRRVLYEVLASARRLDLFPKAYLTHPAMAEADLVYWLCHPNELQGPPDEIELMGRVAAPGAGAGVDLVYYVFRFRTKPPHWKADEGWIAGVAGPYDLRHEPAPYAAGTFSHFEPYDSRSPEAHVKVTHESVLGK